MLNNQGWVSVGIDHDTAEFAVHSIRRWWDQAIVSLIASTTTRTGSIVKAALDTNHYETAIKVSDNELAQLRLKRHAFHGDWNYTLLPRPSRKIV